MAEAKDDWRVKEALMLMVGTIQSEIWKDDDLKVDMEALMKQNVLKEL